MNSAFPHYERLLTNRLGLNRDELRQLRKEHMTEGVHFQTIKSKIHLSDAGLAVLQKITRAVPDAPAEPVGAPDPVPFEKPAQCMIPEQREVVTLHFWSTTRNSRIILCKKPADREPEYTDLLRVAVRKSQNFRRADALGNPMEVPCHHISADLYELARDCPRGPGRW